MGISKNMFNGYADCIKKHKKMGAVIIAGAANIPEAETSYVSSRATSIVNKLTFTGKKLEQVEQEIIDLFGKKSYKPLTCLDFNLL